MEKKIGKYVIIKPLGSGAFAEAFLAENPVTKRRVAIKLGHVEYDSVPVMDGARKREINKIK